MINEEAVDVIHAIAFGLFWVFLAVGAISVSARVAFYKARGYRMPRLLSRDVVFMGGFALSFGLILVARVLPADLVDYLRLRDNVAWALLTDAPAIAGVFVFAYFELFVIERAKPGETEIRDLRGSIAIEDAIEDAVEDALDAQETLRRDEPRV